MVIWWKSFISEAVPKGCHAKKRINCVTMHLLLTVAWEVRDLQVQVDLYRYKMDLSKETLGPIKGAHNGFQSIDRVKVKPSKRKIKYSRCVKQDFNHVTCL